MHLSHCRTPKPAPKTAAGQLPPDTRSACLSGQVEQQVTAGKYFSGPDVTGEMAARAGRILAGPAPAGRYGTNAPKPSLFGLFG